MQVKYQVHKVQGNPLFQQHFYILEFGVGVCTIEYCLLFSLRDGYFGFFFLILVNLRVCFQTGFYL